MPDPAATSSLPSTTPTIPSPSSRAPDRKDEPKAEAPKPTSIFVAEKDATPLPTVKVQNVSRRMLTLVLGGKHLAADVVKPGHPHRHAPVKLVAFRETKDGKLTLFSRTKHMPTALRIPAGDTVDVHPDALGCPEVVKAMARGQLRKIETKRDPKADETKDAT
jgi:hypothetical protein